MKFFLRTWAAVGTVNQLSHCSLMWLHAASSQPGFQVPHVSSTWHVVTLSIALVFLATGPRHGHGSSYRFFTLAHIANCVVATVQIARVEGMLVTEFVGGVLWAYASLIILFAASTATVSEVLDLVRSFLRDEKGNRGS